MTKYIKIILHGWLEIINEQGEINFEQVKKPFLAYVPIPEQQPKNIHEQEQQNIQKQIKKQEQTRQQEYEEELNQDEIPEDYTDEEEDFEDQPQGQKTKKEFENIAKERTRENQTPKGFRRERP